MDAPPIARRSPTTREHHGDRFDDPYAWMADRQSTEFVDHLALENAWAVQQTAHLKPLADTVYEEFRSRIEETDLSVPVRHSRWWYYTRTIEGKQYCVEGRVLAEQHPERPSLDGGGAPSGEEVLLDQNAESVGHEFFGVGASEVSPAGDVLAYAVDLTGDERYDVRVKRIASGELLDDAVKRTGGSLAFSLDGRQVFYTRVDDAWRPYQVWRHEIGTPADDDVLVHDEPRRAVLRRGRHLARRPPDRHRHRQQDDLGVPAHRRGRPAREAAGRRGASAGGGVRHRAGR